MPVPLHHPIVGTRYVAQTETAAAMWEGRGWVRDDPAVIDPASIDPGDTFDIATATVDELRDYARSNDIDLGGATRKADLIEAITAAPVKNEEP